MRPAQRALFSLVERIFADGVVTAQERHDLRALYCEAGLTVGEVKQVFRAFMKMTWGEVIRDGVLTVEERYRLATIAQELRLPLDCVPPDVALALAVI